MAENHDSRIPSFDNPIACRDINGTELTVTVTERCSLIVIQIDGDFEGDHLILPPESAVALVMAILYQLGGRLVPPAGPFSSTF